MLLFLVKDWSFLCYEKSWRFVVESSYITCTFLRTEELWLKYCSLFAGVVSPVTRTIFERQAFLVDQCSSLSKDAFMFGILQVAVVQNLKWLWGDMVEM